MASEPLGNDDFPCPECGTMVRQFHHAHYPWAGDKVGLYMGHCECCRVVVVMLYGPQEGREYYGREFERLASQHWKFGGYRRAEA
jgi:hypothetical protein